MPITSTDEHEEPGSIATGPPRVPGTPGPPTGPGHQTAERVPGLSRDPLITS
jgi:hypothetical protein